MILFKSAKMSTNKKTYSRGIELLSYMLRIKKFYHCDFNFVHAFHGIIPVYIIDGVWAAVLQECRQSFQQNRLHSHIQSDVDGKLKRLETFRNKLADAERRSFHFEQV